MGPVQRQGPADQVASARLQRYEEMAAEADRTRKLDFEEIQIPPGPRLGSTVIEVKDLKKGFGDRVLIDDLSFSLPRNGIVGVIGPNGVGKTTLFKTIVGLEEPDDGAVKVGETVKISYVDQARSGLDPKKNLWETVSDGLDFLKVGNVEIPSRAYVSQFGFKGPDQQKPTGVLSGGERNRLNLALTLKQGGNLLLLDEPTNDLDVETLGSLENALLEFPGCAVVISHDRWFLDRVATHILAYEGTEENPSSWYWFEGNYEAYEANKVERLGDRRGPAAPGDLPQADPRLTRRPGGPPAVARRRASRRSTVAMVTDCLTTNDDVGAVPHTGRVDGRWILLTLVVAVAAAIRWRRRAPDAPPPSGAERPRAADVVG